MYTNFALYWGFPLSRLCLMLMPILALLWGVTLAETSVVDVLSYCLPAMVGPMITNQFLHGRFRWPLISELYQVIQSVHLARSELQLFRNLRAPTFFVTPKAEILEEDFLSDLAKPFYLLLAMSFAALVACALRLMHEPAQREMWLFIGFWAAADCMFLLCALGVTFERRQRRTEPRTPAAGSAQLQTPSNRLHHGVLTDVSVSGAGLLLSNHADVWHALIHRQSVLLRADDKFIFDAQIQKITQRDDGQISVGISYQLDSVANERAAVAIVYGSSTQLRKNLASCHYRRHLASMIVTLLSKAVILGLGHLGFLLKPKKRKSPWVTAHLPRLLWEKNHESTDASLPSSRHRNIRVDDRLRNDAISVR
jgi:cellulose synthase (UDP-forming)